MSLSALSFFGQWRFVCCLAILDVAVVGQSPQHSLVSLLDFNLLCHHAMVAKFSNSITSIQPLGKTKKKKKSVRRRKKERHVGWASHCCVVTPEPNRASKPGQGERE